MTYQWTTPQPTEINPQATIHFNGQKNVTGSTLYVGVDVSFTVEGPDIDEPAFTDAALALQAALDTAGFAISDLQRSGTVGSSYSDV